jgi:hypothetical protein
MGQRYEQSLLTEVSNVRPGEQVTTLTVLLNGAFDRIQATVGREEREAAKGNGYVYFEIWGDDRLLVKSDAIGALRSPGGLGGGPDQPVRRGNQDLEASLQGVLQLKLVTRYALDLPQRVRSMERARGCVWANPRLLPGVGYIGRRASDPLRDALRVALTRLTALTLVRLQGGDAGLRLFPLPVGVAPLRPTVAGTSETIPEPVVRAALQELLTEAQQNRKSLFRTLERKGARLLTETFPMSRAETDETGALVEAGRKAGAALVMTGSYTPGPEGRVSLYAVDTRTGVKSEPIEVTIASLRGASAVSVK